MDGRRPVLSSLSSPLDLLHQSNIKIHVTACKATFLSALEEDASRAGLSALDAGLPGDLDLARLPERDGISPRNIFWKASA